MVIKSDFVLLRDIIKFHALYWPAMLIAAGIEPPKVVYAHGFFTVDGQKMSKSLGNVIDPNNLLDEFSSDAVRYLLLSQFPFGNDGDVKAGEFAIQYNADLANGIGNLVSRVVAMTEKYFAGKVPTVNTPPYQGGVGLKAGGGSEEKISPSARGGDTEGVGDLSTETAQVWSKYKDALERFQIDEAIGAIKELNGVCDTYIEKNKPWELAKDSQDKLAVVLYSLLEAIRHLGLLIYPILPETAEKIQVALGQGDFDAKSLKELEKWGGLKSGTKVEKGEPLFPRL